MSANSTRLAERDEPVTAVEEDFGVPWHIEPFPKEPKAVGTFLRVGESFEKTTRTIPTAVFTRKEDALLACAILPALGKRLRFRKESRSRAGNSVDQSVQRIERRNYEGFEGQRSRKSAAA